MKPFPSNLSDSELFRAYQKGDHDAFRAIVARFEPRLKGYLLSRLGNPHDARDVMQDIFLRLHIARNTFAGESLSPWLMQIATNKIRDCIRARKKKNRLEPVVLSALGEEDGEPIQVAVADPPDVRAIRQETAQAVRAILGRLSLKDQELLDAYYLQGRSYAQIGATIGTCEGTIKSRMWMARRHFAAEWANHRRTKSVRVSRSSPHRRCSDRAMEIRIPTSKGMFALASGPRAKEAAKLKWYLLESGYVTHSLHEGKRVFLHRFLMGLESGDSHRIDHINGDRADCRAMNLRIVTHGENSKNRRKLWPVQASFNYVTKRHIQDTWVAMAHLLFKSGTPRQVYLGDYRTAEEAALVVSAVMKCERPEADVPFPDVVPVRLADALARLNASTNSIHDASWVKRTTAMRKAA